MLTIENVRTIKRQRKDSFGNKNGLVNEKTAFFRHLSLLNRVTKDKLINTKIT